MAKVDKSILTADFKKSGKKSFCMPNTRQETQREVAPVLNNVELLTDRCAQIEQSQRFLSDRYDKVIDALRNAKTRSSKMENEIKNQAETITRLGESCYRNEGMIDELQRYMRRDCLEITGIPIPPVENSKQLVREVDSLIGVDLDASHISMAQRLPETKKIKNRIIAKFEHRDKGEEMYKRRGKLAGKKASQLPTIQNEMGKSVTVDGKIHMSP